MFFTKEFNPGKSSLFILLITGIFTVIFLSRSTIKSFAQLQPSFTFTAAGDYSGHKLRTTAVLTGMNPVNSGADLNIALGDLSYGGKKPETAWCDYVKGLVGTEFPFELVPGNHEDDGPTGNNIDNFELCLPHRLTPITGRYSREYFYDYPDPPAGGTPLARFINISPNMTFLDEGTYTYTSGNPHFNWVSDAIDSARASGIKWIVVAMHENCISMGKKPCSIGENLFNLLVNKKVDLILQGHDHNYQRSKQLALSAGCSGIVRNTLNTNCIVDDGSDNEYIKGAGSVLSIVGTGGIGNYDINTADSEAGYFAKWNGVNSNPTLGFLKATVTDTQMTLTFNPMYGPTFTDSYVIVDNSVPTETPVPPTETPIPTPTPTDDPFAPTPTETPIPTVTPTPTDTPIPTETPIVTPTPMNLSLNPVADTFVNANSPNGNLGNNVLLRIISSPEKIAYLKFDLGALVGRTIQSAVLRLFVSNGSNSTQAVKTVVDTSWGELTMTYNNRPLLGDVVTNFTGSVTGTWKEIAVTSAVSASVGQLMSLGIDSTGTDGLDVYSKENSTGKPELVVNFN
ncbi:hypothetical protein A3A74_05885 [Candidatus Roizmanbacteria bacterium RIFCSPLOWO2_01_FULL_35_13]|uniref:Uncharacterized protein n=1 Tax=Candidatus Roizmanbacteria bacterium RIFCSPLOWO2_01_FULL_35_13 TaxID=1802055 RepID=A0A1F7IHW6_9BACT|nr:MAG: hypothetical protein A3A74_05885 [Candidatus Roizmanbacteria bacterium RIFCSPLOWO2_01_FULL_35_13]